MAVQHFFVPFLLIVDALAHNLFLHTLRMSLQTMTTYHPDPCSIRTGAPNNNAGWNTVFRGMKFSHWEGGHRVPAFIGGPAVSSVVSGKWSVVVML